MTALRSHFPILQPGALTLGAVAGHACTVMIAVAAAAIGAMALLEEPHAFAWAHEALAQDALQAHARLASLETEDNDRADVEALAANHPGARSRARRAPERGAGARPARAMSGCAPGEAAREPAPYRHELGDYPLVPVGATLLPVG